MNSAIYNNNKPEMDTKLGTQMILPGNKNDDVINQNSSAGEENTVFCFSYAGGV